MEEFIDHKWISDLQRALGVGALSEFLDLWDLLSHVWRLASSGVRQSLLMKVSSMKLSYSDLQRWFGKHGPQIIADFLGLAAHSNRVFGLRTQSILDEVVHHESITQIWWNDSIPHTSTNY